MAVLSRISWAILFVVSALFIGWIVQPSPTFQSCIQEQKEAPSGQTLSQNGETLLRISERGRLVVICGLELVEKHDGLVTALFTVILTLSTIALWRATAGLFVETAGLRDAADKQRTDTLRSIKATEIAANAAERSADAVQIVEGAYVYPDILTENIADSLSAFRQSEVRTNRLRVSFRFKNFGKTPAIIGFYQADLFHRDGGPRLRSAGVSPIQVAQKTILGAGEATEPMETEIGDFSRQEWGSLCLHQSTRLHFAGEIRYADIWGNKWLFPFEWEYSGAKGRLIPDNQPRSKID